MCPVTDRLLERIRGYLVNGGLFNPEQMEHQKVRDLIIECALRLKIQSDTIEELSLNR